MEKIKVDIRDTIIKLQKEIIFIYGTYTDQIEFTEEDVKALDKLETKIATLS